MTVMLNNTMNRVAAREYDVSFSVFSSLHACGILLLAKTYLYCAMLFFFFFSFCIIEIVWSNLVRNKLQPRVKIALCFILLGIALLVYVYVLAGRSVLTNIEAKKEKEVTTL